jgi:hypothetical protein
VALICLEAECRGHLVKVVDNHACKKVSARTANAKGKGNGLTWDLVIIWYYLWSFGKVPPSKKRRRNQQE